MTGGTELNRGWRLVLTAAVGLISSPSSLPIYSIGILVGPLQLSHAWSRGQIQAAVLFSQGLGAICAPIVGYLIPIVGIRRFILLGQLGLTFGFVFAAGMSNSIWEFYTAYAIMAVLGAGTGAVSWSRLIAGSFQRNRGFALGLALSGTGFCAMLAPLYAAFLLNSYGWRITYVGLALAPLLTALPLSYFLIPKDAGTTSNITQRAQNREDITGISIGRAVKSYRFWTLAVSVTLIYLAISGVIPNLVPLLTDGGMARRSAAVVSSIVGLSMILGRASIGWTFDRFWAPAIAVMVLIPAAIACAAMTLHLGFYGYLVAAAFVGMATGVELDVLAYLVARYFGMFQYAQIYGVLFGIVSLAAGLGPMAFAHIYDITGSYGTSLNIAATLFFAGAMLLLVLGRYPHLDMLARSVSEYNDLATTSAQKEPVASSGNKP
jgi:MFS family permease